MGAYPEYKSKLEFAWQNVNVKMTDFFLRLLRPVTKHYEVDYTNSSVVTVTSMRGIIDILNFTAPYSPGTNFSNPGYLGIRLADEILLADKYYVQLTPYYNQAFSDEAIPYLVPFGYSADTLNIKVYDAFPGVAGADQFTGPFYVYYELYKIA